MLLSYIVGQKKNPVRYPLKSIGIYVLIAGGFYAIMPVRPKNGPYGHDWVSTQCSSCSSSDIS